MDQGHDDVVPVILRLPARHAARQREPDDWCAGHAPALSRPWARDRREERHLGRTVVAWVLVCEPTGISAEDPCATASDASIPKLVRIQEVVARHAALLVRRLGRGSCRCKPVQLILVVQILQTPVAVTVLPRQRGDSRKGTESQLELAALDSIIVVYLVREPRFVEDQPHDGSSALRQGGERGRWSRVRPLVPSSLPFVTKAYCRLAAVVASTKE